MFNVEYYPDMSPYFTCFHEKRHHKHDRYFHDSNPNGFYYMENNIHGQQDTSNNNVFFTLLIIALIFLVKNKSRLYS